MIHLYKKLGFIFNENFSISTGLKSEAYNKVILAIKSNKDNLKLENDLNKPNFYKKHHTNPKSKYYIDETFGLPTLEESIDLIHSAGGIAILAHSCAYGFQTNELENFITFAIKSGIDGLELKYPTHTYSDEEKIKKYCEKFKLLTTCGSDYHGDKIKQGINLGKGHKNYRFKDSDIVEILAKLKNK